MRPHQIPTNSLGQPRGWARVSSVSLRWTGLVIAIVWGSVCVDGSPAGIEPPPASRRPDVPERFQAPLLLEYYDEFLETRDYDTFRTQVNQRYTESTLARLLEDTPRRVRLAALLGLRELGSMESNQAVASCLADEDPGVREFARETAWTIWFRGDSPEDAEALEGIREQIARGQLREAIGDASALIEASPEFAEAYNQRAIAHFVLGDLEASVTDCQRVLELNPVHFGALDGLGQCYLRLERFVDALGTFRRGLRLSPYNDRYRQIIEILEAQIG